MLLLFFKLIITPSPHNLTSASQQNTSKPSLHKKGTQQPLWGVSWDCLAHITLFNECVSPNSTQTSSFIYYFIEDSNYSVYVLFSTSTGNNKWFSFWAEKKMASYEAISDSILYLLLHLQYWLNLCTVHRRIKCHPNIIFNTTLYCTHKKTSL